MTDDIIIQKSGRIGHISLNRPKVIHSLNLDMCLAMTEALLAWRDDDEVEAIILDHSEGRGFCAGGDIAMLRDSGLTDGKQGREFFYKEYQLNHLMFEYPKPIIAFMDGITMGGGVGISQPAKYRVATENTRFAMPETGIGLFPDVGGGWYLSRLNGRLGQFLALTGARLNGAECKEVGIATHYLSAEALVEAKQRIMEKPDRIEGILGQLSDNVPEARITNNLDKIDKFFASDRYEDILAALEADDSDWAAKERDTLGTKSPQTCKVALRQLKEGAAMESFADEMRNEYRIGYHVLVMHDFLEGVRALIVDKDNDPKWNPPTPEDVSAEWIDNIFAPLPADEEMETTMTYETILTEQRGSVTLITLNRPKSLNALNSQVLDELIDAFAAFQADETQNCAVLTGSGDKAFAAGADIKEMYEKSAADFYLEDFFAKWTSHIVKATRKPWIAAVNGFALGGGCELAMMADIIIVSDKAKFGQPEIKLGVAPGMGGSQRLTRAVGKSKSMDMCLTGRMMDAEEAERSGLVARVVPHDELLDEALKSAAIIASMPPMAIQVNKEMVNSAFENNLDQGLVHERRLFQILTATEDKKEGMAAFIEKREGQWMGR